MEMKSFFCCTILSHTKILSFPTRRSSDLGGCFHFAWAVVDSNNLRREQAERKSTRLNSSHVAISYAVFCLKKKNQNVKKRPACSELRWAYCNHKATYFASYLTGGECVPDDQN